ncbi:MAG: glutathione S-transferase family protein [Minwuia sp.]|uniref:glutathione S-transferase family protein n=1 Tax=Minwuia sp. TaxID=2493630 RepID=UPI003A87F9A8
MSKLIIHGPAASRAMRAQWMANELGVEFETATEKFRDGSTRTPEYLAVNRAGHVPAIQDGDFGMGESCAINIYLAKKHGKLMPSGLENEARVLEWSFWVMTDVERHMLDFLFHAAMLPEDQRDTEVVANAVKALDWPLTVLDGYLKDHEWLVGDSFTVADLNVAAVLLWGKLGRMDMSNYPNVTEWLGRCLSRPAVPKR